MLKGLVILLVIIFMADTPSPEDLSLDATSKTKPAQVEDLTLSDTGSSPEGLTLENEDILLSVGSVPEGARIYLDGLRFGITPVAGKKVTPGEHFISVRMDGSYPYEKDISILSEDSIDITLPVVNGPDGYEKARKDAESAAGMNYDLLTGAFGKWVDGQEHESDELVRFAEGMVHLAEQYGPTALRYDALRCRNSAAGYYLILELAAGTSYFSGSPETSISLWKRVSPDAIANEEAMLALIQRFIVELGFSDGYTRAVAAHALRNTYSSMKGSDAAREALEQAATRERVEFISMIINESLEQLGYGPEEQLR